VNGAPTRQRTGIAIADLDQGSYLNQSKTSQQRSLASYRTKQQWQTLEFKPYHKNRPVQGQVMQTAHTGLPPGVTCYFSQSCETCSGVCLAFHIRSIEHRFSSLIKVLSP